MARRNCCTHPSRLPWYLQAFAYGLTGLLVPLVLLQTLSSLMGDFGTCAEEPKRCVKGTIYYSRHAYILTTLAYYWIVTFLPYPFIALWNKNRASMNLLLALTMSFISAYFLILQANTLPYADRSFVESAGVPFAIGFLIVHLLYTIVMAVAFWYSYKTNKDGFETISDAHSIALHHHVV